jgi:penicillin-binding protein 1A
VNGTGRRAQVEGVPAAGKTGTTSSYRDAWFAGFTGNYVAAVWFGNDDYRPTRRVTGGTLPAMTWQKFMEYAHTNIEVRPLYGVDFEPRPYVVAETEEGESEGTERPPSLQPEAALKLLEMADLLDAALRRDRPFATNAQFSVSEMGD